LKIVYLLQNHGIEHSTPAGWDSAVITADPAGGYSEEDLREVEGADVLVVGLEPVDESMLDRARELKLIQRLGRGYNNIDLEAAARRGIPVCGMPDFNAAAVAEHALMLMLALLRRVFDATLVMKAGRWPIMDIVGRGNFELRGKRVGIVGLGAIGRAVADRVRAFEAEVCYYDRVVGAQPELEAVGLERLLQESDIVTLHIPLTPETSGLIGRQELALMKPRSLLINTARGALVDEEALAAALREGTIAGAGIDVFVQEPLPASHPLRSCPNILLTPHTGGQTREAMARMVSLMLENIERLSRGDELLDVLTDRDPAASRP
jgi:phosphoglycerate dehydrogenase-like enzyme